MELNIKTIEEIKTSLLKESEGTNPFPDTVDFPFPECYKQIVTKIDTIDISFHCQLYNSTYSKTMTELNYDCDLVNSEDKNKIKNYWFIGENPDDDYWLMDKSGKIYYWRSGAYKEKYSLEDLTDVNIDFKQWLQFAYLEKEKTEILDEIFDSDNDEVTMKSLETETKNKYFNIIKSISKELYELFEELFYNTVGGRLGLNEVEPDTDGKYEAWD